MAKKGNRFDALRQLRSQRQSEPEDVVVVEGKTSVQVIEAQTPKPKDKKNTQTKRAVGRPPGRRSDPRYTQLSAYVPLELLFAVQDKLACERRVAKQRTSRPVSALIEELLDRWLKMQKRENLKS